MRRIDNGAGRAAVAPTKPDKATSRFGETLMIKKRYRTESLTTVGSLMLMLNAYCANAQDVAQADADTVLEEITVTGTSLRGSAPAGSSVIRLDTAVIEENAVQTV